MQGLTLAGQNESPALGSKGYGAVRHNALKHGILSRLVVLPHEDAGEFAALLEALISEHLPGGATERALVEELAAILWRKRRVLMAEAAKIQRELWGVTHNEFHSPIPAAAPFEPGLSGRGVDLLDLMTISQPEAVERQQCAEKDLVATHKAQSVLRRGGADAYEKARRALLVDSRDWWDEQVQEGTFPATPEGLDAFLRDQLEPLCHHMVREARLQPAIRAQVLGEGLQAHQMEQLSRYETHLDRKFERTLAMLLKLRELRPQSGPDPGAPAPP